MPKFKKVLHVHTLPVISGSGINTLLTMQGLPERYQPALACRSGGRLETAVRQAGIPFYPIDAFTQPISPINDLLALSQLIRLQRKHRFDIIHTHNSKAGFLGRLAGRFCRTPVIIHTIHGFAFHDCESAWRRNLFIQLERQAAHWCDELIAISQPMIDWAILEKIAPRGSIRKIYSGIDIEPFAHAQADQHILSQAKFTSNDFIIGFFAKLWEGKGHLDALQALALARNHEPRLKLLIVGEGPLAAQLQLEISRLGLADAVFLAGFQRDIPSLTASCNAVILPSYYEGMGRVVLEGMAAGKPVIASFVGGIKELILDGETGIFITPGEIEQLSQKLLMLTRSPEFCQRLGRQAQAAVGKKYSAQHMVQKITELYDKLTSHK